MPILVLAVPAVTEKPPTVVASPSDWRRELKDPAVLILRILKPTCRQILLLVVTLSCDIKEGRMYQQQQQQLSSYVFLINRKINNIDVYV